MSPEHPTSTSNCLFCRIVDGDLPAEVVLRTDAVVAFRDVSPQAPTHVLVVPTEHLPSIEAITPEHAGLLDALVAAANEVARSERVAGGFRLVTNIGPAAGQSVDHLHLHVLGGREMGWPPG